MNIEKSLFLLSIVSLMSIFLVINSYNVQAAEEYKFKSKFGSKGADNGKFIQPIGIAVDKEGNIYVGDFARHSNIIQKFSDNGTFISSGGTLGSSPGFFTNPVSLEIDRNNGFLYIS